MIIKLEVQVHNIRTLLPADLKPTMFELNKYIVKTSEPSYGSGSNPFEPALISLLY
jgi:hypothetical protein